MLLIIGGMIRSGSTFSFNIARELLATQGVVAHAAGNSLPANTDGDAFLLKSHAPGPELLARIRQGEISCICTVRSPEEAIASWRNTFGFTFEEGLRLVDEWYSWYVPLADKVLTLPFPTIENSPDTAIWNISRHLRLNPSPSLVSSLAQKYSKASIKALTDTMSRDGNIRDIGFSYFDKETLFHRRHISRGTPPLTSAELAEVRDRLAPHLERLEGRTG